MGLAHGLLDGCTTPHLLHHLVYFSQGKRHPSHGLTNGRLLPGVDYMLNKCCSAQLTCIQSKEVREQSDETDQLFSLYWA